MKKFLKKNNKKVMAFFGVFLMIAFAAQTRYGSGMTKSPKPICNQRVSSGNCSSRHW